MAQRSLALHPSYPGHADSRHRLPRALGSPVLPKPSAWQTYLAGEGVKKAEGRPSGESRLARKVSTDHCMHPPLGGAPRDWGFLPCVRPESIRCCSQRPLQTVLCSPQYQGVGPRGHRGSAQCSKPRAHRLYTWMEVVNTKIRYRGLI